MFERAKRVGQLVSSNVESLLDKASDPRKMLLLMRSEIEDSLVALQGDLARATRRADRLAENAKKRTAAAEDWTAKAKVAVDKGREDLARSALLARESDRRSAEQLEADAEGARREVHQIKQAIEELETKRAQTLEKLDELPKSAKRTACHTSSPQTGKAERRLDNVAAMERRMDFSVGRGHEVSSTDVDAEIDRLQQDSAIDAEIAAMAGKGKSRRKPKR